MSNPGLEVFEGELLGEQAALSLEELCRQFAVPREHVVALVEEGVVRADAGSGQWHFDLHAVRRVRIAVRLQRDLEVNLAGVALVLDLLEELESLRGQFRG